MIPFCKLAIKDHYADAVASAVLDGHVGPGPLTAYFAHQLAEYTGVKHCVLTTSGTVALSVAARALDLNPGDTILVPAYGVISTINAFTTIGLKPRLVDIRRDTACMDPERLQDILIDNKPDAVCFVNFSGYTGIDLVHVRALCKSFDVPLIEDAACALGHYLGREHAGNFGDIATLSFAVPKLVTTSQGGALLTNNDYLYERSLQLIDQGGGNWRESNLHRGIGSNLRFNDVLSALGLAQLDKISEIIEQKEVVCSLLKRRLFGNMYDTPSGVPLHNITFTEERDKLIKHLREYGVSARFQYRTTSQHPVYAELEGDFPNADWWTEHAVYLPYGNGLTVRDARVIAEAVRDSGVELCTS